MKKTLIPLAEQALAHALESKVEAGIGVVMPSKNDGQ
jgi:hypothetical protein